MDLQSIKKEFPARVYYLHQRLRGSPLTIIMHWLPPPSPRQVDTSSFFLHLQSINSNPIHTLITNQTAIISLVRIHVHFSSAPVSFPPSPPGTCTVRVWHDGHATTYNRIECVVIVSDRHLIISNAAASRTNKRTRSSISNITTAADAEAER